MIALLLACRVETEPEEELVVVDSIQQLWAGEAGVGATVTVDAVVTSPLDPARPVFYVQDAEGGARSGLRVHLVDVIVNWPPQVGTPVRLKGNLRDDGDGPGLGIDDPLDAAVIGDVTEPVVVPFDPDQLLVGALVEVDVEQTSATDPTGAADLDGLVWGGEFLPAPGYGARGTAVGVLSSTTRISPTSFDETRAPSDPLDVALDEVRDLDDGTPVRLEAVQAVAWSRSERFTLVQDGDDVGVWVDVEGWGVGGLTTVGDRLEILAEVRHDGAHTTLRIWDPPTVVGTGAPTLGTKLKDGALAQLVVSELTGPDASRRWTADEVVLDDRFLELVDLPDVLEVAGPVRVDGGTKVLSPTVILGVEE